MPTDMMEQNVSPFPQPIQDCPDYPVLRGAQEEIEYLPGTSLRIRHTHLSTSFPAHWHNALEIVNYINHNYSEELAVDETAKRFGLSEYYFSRLFQPFYFQQGFSKTQMLHPYRVSADLSKGHA